ncbi:MAG: hypothetical protein K9G65_05975, partial [Rickettsiaceae bacterium]|nr:hypothetical protein [Rickettsiaceae bacterium]
ELKNSDLIVSDNHVLPLNIFSNAILMGSFLWHDVTTPLSIEGQEIINFEIDLLLKLRPPLICLGDMVMPSLRNQTNLLEQGWFTNRTTLLPTKNKEKKRVLITGGGTELINKQLLALTLVVISRLPNIEFFLDSKLFEMAKKNETKLSKFSFTESDFASLDFIICRPGVGILTDCVRFSVPPLVINDGFNREINHNSTMVNELGIGMGLDINENNINEVAEKLCKVIENDQLKLDYIKALKNRTVNGAYSASREIINFLNNG